MFPCVFAERESVDVVGKGGYENEDSSHTAVCSKMLEWDIDDAKIYHFPSEHRYPVLEGVLK